MSGEVVDPKSVDSNPEEKKPEEKFVSRDAYQTVSTDMMKYKEEKNNLKAELEKMRADEQARQEAEQLKNGEYQKLADTYKQKYEESEASRAAEKKRVMDLHKLHHIERATGGFQKSEYAKIAANLEAVQVDENGLIVEESLMAEAARIRQEHPALLKSNDKAKLPNLAPGQHESLSYEEGLKLCKTQKELTTYMDKHGRL